MSINLTVVIDNEKALEKFKELQQVAKKTTSSIVSDSDRMDMAIRKIGGALGALGISVSLQQFAKQVATVRGEFQQLEVAFSTMLGSKAEADKLMARTVDFAAKTPFDLQGVANGTKQLLAFGSEAETVTDEMRMLGDIAAGLSLPIGDLVYLYGTTRTQGRMFTMDLRQFMSRGIPLADELAKIMKVNKDQVAGLVTEGKVGFEEMKKALQAMTSEGGKFYNLMDAQSKTITGQMSNLEDSIDQMFNAIGKESEEAISKALQGASWLVDNYEKIGRILLDVIAAYGAYKAAIIAVNAMKKVNAMYAAAEIAAAEASAIAHKKVTAAMILQEKALNKLNVAKYLTNPYVLAGAAIAGVIYGTYKLVTAKSREERAREAANKQIEKENRLIEENNQRTQTSIDKAVENARILKDTSESTTSRAIAQSELLETYPELFEKYDIEKIKLMDIADLKREILELERERTIASYQQIVEDARKELSTLEANVHKNFQGGKWVITTDADGEEGDKLRAKIELYTGLIKKERELQEAERFRALSDENKIKYIDKKIKELQEALNKPEEFTYPEQGAELRGKIASLQEHKEELKKKDDKKDDLDDEEKRKQKEIAKARQDAIKEANKAEYELKKEGIEDKVKLLELEKEEELKAIDERIKATTDKDTQDALKRTRVATENRFNHRIAAEKRAQQDEANKARAEDEREEAEYLNSLLGEFASYHQKREAIIKEYKKKEDALYQTKDGVRLLKDGVTEDNVNILRKTRDQELLNLSEEHFADDEVFKDWLERISDATINKIKQEIDALKKIAATIASPEDKARVEHMINTAEELVESKEGKGDKSNKDDITKWTSFVSALTDVGNAAQDALDNIEGMDSGLKQMLTDTVSLVSGVGNLVTAIKGVGAAAKGIEKANDILIAISAAIQVVSTIFSFFSKGESSMERNLRQFKELNTELEELKNRAKLDNWEDTIFGEDSFGKASNAVKVYNEALNRYNETVDKIVGKSKLYDSPFGYIGGFGGNQFSGAANNIDDAIKNMQVQTRHSTWFRDSQYASLGDLLPELFDEDGKVDFEGLKEFMDSDMFSKLSAENQEMIKSLVADWELYEDALDEMKGYLSNIFGGLGDELTDALVDAFEKGTDASKAFADSVSNMLETFAKDMVKTLFFTDILKKAEEDILKTMKDDKKTDEEKFAKYAAILNEATKEAAENQDDAVKFLNLLKKIAAENGIDIFKGDVESQTATSKGFQAMSQDTGDELNGRFTDIQGKVTDIRSFITEIVYTGKLQWQETVNIRDIMLQVSGNVADIRTYTQVLPAMSETMISMNRKLENL